MSDEKSNVPLVTEVVVRYQHGMHLRRCGEVAHLASGFTSTIIASNSRRRADAKSVLSLSTLAASCGDRLKISVSGPDAEEALAAMEEYFSREPTEQ